jgi:hypothetical protein
MHCHRVIRDERGAYSFTDVAPPDRYREISAVSHGP